MTSPDLSGDLELPRRSGPRPTTGPEIAHQARRNTDRPTLVMIYGPRDAAELETVWRLVEISHAFARGQHTSTPGRSA
jgi:hypothetical protein